MLTGQDWGIYQQVRRLIRSGYDRRNLARLLDVLTPAPEKSAKPVSEVLERLDGIVPGGAAIVRVWNDDTNELEPVLCHNIKDKTACVDGDPQFALPRHVFDTERPDLTQRAWYHRQLHQERGFGSCLSVPLIWRNLSVGVVSFSTRSERKFTHAELLGLSILADEIAAKVGQMSLRRYASGR